MDHLNPDELYIDFIDGTNADGPNTPRIYTLTHSVMTGDLYLTISQRHNFSQISGFYTRLMRDEVLAKWDVSEGFPLHIPCHVSGGFVFGGLKCAIGYSNIVYAWFWRHSGMEIEFY